MADPHPEPLCIDPPLRNTLVAFAAAAVLAAFAVVADVGGRLLLLPAGAVAFGVGLRDLVRRPLLRADAQGLEVVHGWRRVRAPWSEVHHARVVRDRRAVLLEVELAGTLVVLSRARLGRDPADLVVALQQLSR